MTWFRLLITYKTMNEAEKYLIVLEKEYKTFDVVYRFNRTIKDDFDYDKKNKVIIKRKEMKYLLDILPLNLRSKIQYWSQFSLWLTYNHIWAYYDEIQEECVSYIINYVWPWYLES